MNPELKIGDRVEVLDDTTQGIVTAISNGWVTLESTDGFILRYRAAELVRVSRQQRLYVSSDEAARIKSEEAGSVPKRQPVSRRRERNAPQMEVDLHIHQLVPTVRGMSTYDILNLQLETAKKRLEFAIQKRISKVVFIHGVGEGILKEELHYLFNRYENLRYYDADYQKYGLGATEVYIFQNP